MRQAHCGPWSPRTKCFAIPTVPPGAALISRTSWMGKQPLPGGIHQIEMRSEDGGRVCTNLSALGGLVFEIAEFRRAVLWSPSTRLRQAFAAEDLSSPNPEAIRSPRSAGRLAGW